MADAKAFAILADRVYTHKVRAVIREISCNAYDSHVESGNTQPFDVHLPTTYEPWFSVRDYGTGIEHEQMLTFYTQAFASTRQKSNQYVGNLGIGRLSCLALVDSFTVTSYVDGIESIYSVYKDANGLPTLSTLSQSPTTEPNGLLVKVSSQSHRVAEFYREARYVYRFFDIIPNINVSTIKREIDSDLKKYTVTGDGFAVATGYGQLFAVMGNVCYEIDRSLNPKSLDGYIRFNIGDLNFDPGREKLSLDDKTKNIVTKRIGEVYDSIAKLAIDKIRAEPTVFKKAIMQESLYQGNLSGIIQQSSYHKEFVSYRLPKPTDSVTRFRRGRKGTCSIDTYSNLPMRDVYYLLRPGYTARIKAYVREYGSDIIGVTDEQVKELSIDAEFIKNPDTLPKPTKVPNKVSPNEIYELSRTYGTKMVTTVPDEEKVYIEVCRNESVHNAPLHGIYHIIDKVLPAVEKCVTIPQLYTVKTAYTKTKKFREGNWISLPDYLQREAAKTKKVKVMTYEGEYNDVFRRLSKYVPKTHKIYEFVEKYDRYKKQKHDSVLIDLGFCDTTSTDTSLDTLEAEILAKYPMLGVVNVDKFGYNSMERECEIIAKYVV